MSSLGDIVHTFPAITDAKRALPELTLDWVVEEAFSDIPLWHPGVNQVIPVAIRRWRKHLLSRGTRLEWRQFKNSLNQQPYDLVIDAQGLLKSAGVLRCVSGVPTAGYSWRSAREGLASVFYDQRIEVSRATHAVERTRHLLGAALGYEVGDQTGRYGLKDLASRQPMANADSATPEPRKVLFAHGTTWTTKHWPDECWTELAALCHEQGLQVVVPWYSDQERARAMKIHAASPSSQLLPKMGLEELKQVMASMSAMVAVDTGLGHIAAALEVPTISLYGPTDPKLTGAYGADQIHMKSSLACSPCLKRSCQYKASEFAVYPPCFGEITPELVLSRLVEAVH